MKNTTLGRKPGNDMKKDAGLVKPVRRSDRSGDGADFAYNGQMGDGVNRASNPYAKNAWSGHSNDGRTVNFGRGPTKGNASSAAMDIGPSATKDPKKMTIATASQGGIIGAGFKCPSYGNPDAINVGMKK